MLHFFSTFNSALSQNVGIPTIYHDLSKSFDTVSHQKLKYKLNKISLYNNIVCWIQNYQSNKKFYVHVNNVISSTFDTISDVLQGSSFGPLLHVIYTDGLAKIIKNCEIF